MSLSYTGDETMDEPALRDLERWKDKIEVRLDNRQVFFLFFGSALCACMLFVLGVIVGKRLESRGRATAPEVQDPLAVLDRISAAGPAGSASAATLKTDQALTFPNALIAAPGRGRGASAAVAAKPSSLAVRMPVAVKPPPARPTAPTALSAPAATSPGPTTSASPAARARFALQLSSFPDRNEADAFARKFSSQGAYVVVSEIPGKGTWYRVRVGNYASSQEAIAAKGAFERQTNVIAYIAGR